MTEPSSPTRVLPAASLPTHPERATVIFDGSCDFCTRSARLLRWLDRRGRLTLIPFQKPGTPEAHGLTIADCERVAWAVTPDGRHFSGAAAINVGFATALGTRLPWLLYRLPGLRWLQDRIYALIAHHRSRLPGDTPYCEQHPDECGGDATGSPREG